MPLTVLDFAGTAGDQRSPERLLSDVDAKRQQELPRKRVREPARQRTFCKVGKFIRLSYSKFGGRYPKQKLTLSLRALPLPPVGATPLPEGGFRVPTLDKTQYL